MTAFFKHHPRQRQWAGESLKTGGRAQVGLQEKSRSPGKKKQLIRYKAQCVGNLGANGAAPSLPVSAPGPGGRQRGPSGPAGSAEPQLTLSRCDCSGHIFSLVTVLMAEHV